MLKVANILMAAFLALAPGMDAVALLHAVQACEFGAKFAAGTTHDHEGHDHGDEPCDTPPQDCPHFKHVPHGSPALLAAAPVSVFLPGPPICALPDVAAAPVVPLSRLNEDSRPPPGPPLVGCVKLLV